MAQPNRFPEPVLEDLREDQQWEEEEEPWYSPAGPQRCCRWIFRLQALIAAVPCAQPAILRHEVPVVPLLGLAASIAGLVAAQDWSCEQDGSSTKLQAWWLLALAEATLVAATAWTATGLAPLLQQLLAREVLFQRLDPDKQIQLATLGAALLLFLIQLCALLQLRWRLLPTKSGVEKQPWRALYVNVVLSGHSGQNQADGPHRPLLEDSILHGAGPSDRYGRQGASAAAHFAGLMHNDTQMAQLLLELPVRIELVLGELGIIAEARLELQQMNLGVVRVVVLAVDAPVMLSAIGRPVCATAATCAFGGWRWLASEVSEILVPTAIWLAHWQLSRALQDFFRNEDNVRLVAECRRLLEEAAFLVDLMAIKGGRWQAGGSDHHRRQRHAGALANPEDSRRARSSWRASPLKSPVPNGSSPERDTGDRRWHGAEYHGTSVLSHPANRPSHSDNHANGGTSQVRAATTWGGISGKAAPAELLSASRYSHHPNLLEPARSSASVPSIRLSTSEALLPTLPTISHPSPQIKETPRVVLQEPYAGVTNGGYVMPPRPEEMAPHAPMTPVWSNQFRQVIAPPPMPPLGWASPAHAPMPLPPPSIGPRPMAPPPWGPPLHFQEQMPGYF